MIFQNPLTPAIIIQRYKRFLADVKLECGEITTVHCPNSGSMKSCVSTGWPVLLSTSANPKRKYAYTLEMIHNGACWIGINTMVPNRISEEAIKQGRIKELSGYDSLTREVKYGKNSRIDILLKKKKEMCYVEIKNVTLLEEDGCYYFPDSVTERGRKHLDELIERRKQGDRCVMLFVVQRNDGSVFKPAAHIDPQYAEGLSKANNAGVEILVYQAAVTPYKIEITTPLSWKLASA